MKKINLISIFIVSILLLSCSFLEDEGQEKLADTSVQIVSFNDFCFSNGADISEFESLTKRKYCIISGERCYDDVYKKNKCTIKAMKLIKGLDIPGYKCESKIVSKDIKPFSLINHNFTSYIINNNDKEYMYFNGYKSEMYNKIMSDQNGYLTKKKGIIFIAQKNDNGVVILKDGKEYGKAQYGFNHGYNVESDKLSYTEQNIGGEGSLNSYIVGKDIIKIKNGKNPKVFGNGNNYGIIYSKNGKDRIGLNDKIIDENYYSNIYDYYLINSTDLIYKISEELSNGTYSESIKINGKTEFTGDHITNLIVSTDKKHYAYTVTKNDITYVIKNGNIVYQDTGYLDLSSLHFMKGSNDLIYNVTRKKLLMKNENIIQDSSTDKSIYLYTNGRRSSSHLSDYYKSNINYYAYRIITNDGIEELYINGQLISKLSEFSSCNIVNYSNSFDKYSYVCKGEDNLQKIIEAKQSDNNVLKYHNSYINRFNSDYVNSVYSKKGDLIYSAYRDGNDITKAQYYIVVNGDEYEINNKISYLGENINGGFDTIIKYDNNMELIECNL